jgi:hypothetical protein
MATGPGVLTLTPTVKCGTDSVVLDPIYLTVTEDGASGYAPQWCLNFQVLLFGWNGSDYSVLNDSIITVPVGSSFQVFVGAVCQATQVSVSALDACSFDISGVYPSGSLTISSAGTMIQHDGQDYWVFGEIEIHPTAPYGSADWIAVLAEINGVSASSTIFDFSE